ncbi:MAG: MFS transporter [Burkholderiales bacterium]|nr:MFS transporter [Burkholderiales bacterium]
MNRRLLLLVLCQGFFLTNNVTFITINGLVGLRLAPNAWLATLPVTAYVAGSALFAGLVGRHQRAWGRRRAFQLGLVAAMATTALCAWAAWQGHFWLLVAGATLAGYYNANAGLYRFAAIELVEPRFKERAISWVLAGGILGAVVGPNLARWTRDALPAEFAGAYAALAFVALASLVTMSFIRFPPLPLPTLSAPGRPLAEIAAQPVYILAVIACAVGYGVMNLLMAATPIAMAMCAHPFDDAALVIQWHVLGMFVPSFFTGSLIRRFGAVRVIAVGLLLECACVAVALSGVDLTRFLVALFTLGVGWNFLFIGGTTLFTQAYRPEERTTAQASMDTIIFATMTITSFSSGALVTTQGWTLLNLGSIVPLALIGAALLWYAAQQRAALRARTR